MIFGINTTCDISKLSQISLAAHEITYNNFEMSLVVFMPNITTNHAITYTNTPSRMRKYYYGVLKEQYPVTAHAPNFDFWTGCRGQVLHG